ncbi:energy transducer TonB [Undibacterium sp. LX40W]|uniref:Energy transducer TonB n=1 Tax=Undibacterium nitidum TaxID=2762298 RepID=A0A923KSV3_9BURK|nr:MULTISPECIES: energy transducer TonB [Undibacterium]MBC3880652.1 energy transducer TonB [Undibacterium nitidum]MBC3890612.1 energy transducer TonB [Undibacterium sp. LX40W]
MDFHTHPHQAKSKLPSLAVAVGAHAILLWVAMQAVHVINRPDRHIVDIVQLTEPEPPTPPEPKIEQRVDKTMPVQDFIPPPEISTQPTTTNDVITTVTNAAPSKRDFERTEGGENVTPPTTHAPIHIAANVDAKACDKPEYPANSLRAGEEGTVHLAMLIGTDGHVMETKVEKTSGSRALDKAAIQGLSLCKFKPGTVDGVPEKSWAKLQYVWSIN